MDVIRYQEIVVATYALELYVRSAYHGELSIADLTVPAELPQSS